MILRKTYILAALAALAFLVTCLLGIELWRYKAAQQDIVLTEATETTQSIKSELEALLQGVQDKADAMGRTFGEREYSESEIESIVRDASIKNSEIQGVTACYEPYGFRPDKRLFCPYYNKASSTYVYVEDSYDYTIPGDGTAWYTGVIENGAKWAEPYYGTAAKDWFIDYGVPFYFTQGDRQGEIRGMLDFTLSAAEFKNFVHEKSVGKTGYEFIVTREGKFVTHPIADYLGSETLSSLMEAETDATLKAAYTALQSGESGSVEFHDASRNKPALFFYEPVAPAGYGLGIVFYPDEMNPAGPGTSRRIINIALSAALGIIFLIAMIFGHDHLDRREIEQLSFLTTGLLVAIVILVGWLQHAKSRDFDENESPSIVSSAGLGDFVQEVNSRANALKVAPPIAVPTGIYIERLEFADSYNVNIGGQIWMKYPEELAESEDILFGVRFPQISPFAESSLVEEVHREIIPAKEGDAGYLHIIWDFRVTLRLDLSYEDFPFDKRRLNIKLDPASMDDQIILVPDLTSYSNTSASQLPGISPEIDMPGSQITKSYFNFTLEDFKTDFGYNDTSQFQSVPVLHYNVYLKRKLLNPFITYLIPITVALCLIYILILACEKTEARQGIIESMAAFFFVLIFSHIDLRKDIVTPDLIYIEYFYLATYLMVILSTANLIAYTKSRTSLFDFNDNQIYRAVYFPIFFSIILIVSLAKFY